MIRCRNCGKELSELTAGLHYCHNTAPSLDRYCDNCGELINKYNDKCNCELEEKEQPNEQKEQYSGNRNSDMQEIS